MLRTVGIVVCGAVLATGAAAIAAPLRAEGADWAAVSLSNVHAGVRPVTLVISLHTELQCRRLRSGTLAVAFPAAMRLPKAIPASAVTVGGEHPSSVKLAARTLSITIPPPTGVMCDSIAPGTAKILLSRAAQVGNPAAAGSYKLGVRYDTATLTAKFAIKP